MKRPVREAIVVGSGPNGLAAAITLARAGVRVSVHEQSNRAGGGTRTEQLTRPGFLHDVCSAIHPMAVSSPFFRSLSLSVEWVHSPAPLAHPLDDGTAVTLERSVEETARGFGADGGAWEGLMGPFVPRWAELAVDILRPPGLPGNSLLTARFGLAAIRSAESLARSRFRGVRAPALFAGLAAHSCLPLDEAPSAAFGLVLGIAAHAAGWPLARGGSERIADAMLEQLRSLGGEVRTGSRIDRLPDSGLVLCDVTPRQFVVMAGDRLPASFRGALERWRYAPGAFKVDWALDRPIPWRAPECSRAATVHLGGTMEEIAASERDAWDGRTAERPYVILVQPTLFDPSRAPTGMHVAWAYCHVPNGCDADMTSRIEAQVERFAPGFRASILARSVMGPAALEAHNPNLVGGDVGGGASTPRQMLFRPTWRGYATPIAGVYLCSAATPPGGGVHGMCGRHAARIALARWT